MLFCSTLLKGACNLKSASQIPFQAGSDGMWGRLPDPPVSLWLSAGSSCYHFARMKASLGGQTPLCHFQKYLKLPASPFFSNNVLQFWLRDVFLKVIWRFFLCVCLVLASVEISTDYMKNFVQYLHLCHGCWSENSKLLCKGPSYNFYYYREPALAWGFHCSKEV